MVLPEQRNAGWAWRGAGVWLRERVHELARSAEGFSGGCFGLAAAIFRMAAPKRAVLAGRFLETRFACQPLRPAHQLLLGRACGSCGALRDHCGAQQRGHRGYGKVCTSAKAQWEATDDGAVWAGCGDGAVVPRVWRGAPAAASCSVSCGERSVLDKGFAKPLDGCKPRSSAFLCI